MFENIKLIKLLFDKRSENEVALELIKSNKTLSIAESCTGGLLSSLMTDISGSSSYIKANFITYANEAKQEYLNVKKETLETYGAVSNQTATEMVLGLLEKTNADYAIATTGIAGPTGGSKDKPVGLIYIGIGNKNGNIQVEKYNVDDKYPRILIKYLFAKQAAKLLEKFIKENK